MHRNKSVNVHQFAMVPRADIPRSSFRIQKTVKTTFDGGYLIPVFLDEVLPGDSFNLRMTAFARLATPLFPFMDNMYLDSFFFFVPNRLLWENWERFMGSQDNPGSSTDYLLPEMQMIPEGYPALSIYDHFGLPVIGQPTDDNYFHTTLPLRAYNLIWNEWFRDQNLQEAAPYNVTDNGDVFADFILLRRGKRHDYFTSALPFLQKGAAVGIPLAGNAEIVSNGLFPLFQNAAGTELKQLGTLGDGVDPGVVWSAAGTPPTGGAHSFRFADSGPTGLMADLSTATATTINALRLSFQIQKLLERDARGGTRYTEMVRAHFGVMSPDARLQRPEYLGGGSVPIAVNPIAQTSASDVTGSTTPFGSLAAYATTVAHGHGFSQSFTEHGYILGMVSVRADLTYQQGVRRMWHRRTRYDFYFPVFAALGEQGILNKEIFVTGDAIVDNAVFGYQERWAEYRYNPSEIHGYFRSTTSGTIDQWHLAQRFLTLPELNDVFIEDNPPVERVVAVGAEANGQQFLMDAFFDIKAARPMPLYSVPGLIDHF